MDFMSNFQTLSSRREIAAITGVSERTAQRWLSGKSTPKKCHMRLLALYDAGRVMPQKWTSYCRFDDQRLILGNDRAITMQELSWYQYSLYLWHRLLDRIPELESRIEALMKVCPPADVIDLQKYREELEKAKKRPFHIPADYAGFFELEPRQEKLLQRKNGC